MTDAFVTPYETGKAQILGTVANGSQQEWAITEAVSVAFGNIYFVDTVEKDGATSTENVDSWTLRAGASLRWEPTGSFSVGVDSRYPIKNEQKVPITLKCSNGATVDFTATGKDFDGTGGTSEPQPSTYPSDSAYPSWSSTPSESYPTPIEPTYTEQPPYTEAPTDPGQPSAQPVPPS